ncbi:hypothetical protein JCM19240_3402 [Vibrio maritimus]|uniref:Uncharacterized protein n=1 Tax=Vibrio maritimus TaxID=990268 RepID=A0A090TVU8_9VIBR|nr:hypothetical protein JCM19240_3402 [Vibrio maritimus]
MTRVFLSDRKEKAQHVSSMLDADEGDEVTESAMGQLSGERFSIELLFPLMLLTPNEIRNVQGI